VLATGARARFTATGDSMYPFIRSGESLLVERVEPNDLRRGDVVLAKLERGLTAHRIVRIEREQGEVSRIQTRGDNCSENDPPFTPDQLVGRIVLAKFRNLVTIIALVRQRVRRTIR
jgi:signal peptidase I